MHQGGSRSLDPCRAQSDEVFITGDQRNGHNLLVDKDRQYTEDEMRAAILWQSAYRASSARHDYSQLQYQGLSQDAVDFQRAVKDAQRTKTGDSTRRLLLLIWSPRCPEVGYPDDVRHWVGQLLAQVGAQLA